LAVFSRWYIGRTAKLQLRELLEDAGITGRNKTLVIKKHSVKVNQDWRQVNQTRPILLPVISRDGNKRKTILWIADEYQTLMSGIWMKGCAKLLEMLKRCGRTVVPTGGSSSPKRQKPSRLDKIGMRG
jgi:hypothetical protein